MVLATLGLASAGVYIDMTVSDFGVLRNKSDIETPVISDINVPHPNILVLYATVGILTGVGFGLTYLPSMTVIKTHFRVNLGLACGVAQVGMENQNNPEANNQINPRLELGLANSSWHQSSMFC